ncbi:putative lipoprotein LprH [Mycobacterium mantenii]|uniref:Lipoprotein LprH n=1 Tax=Mycobacterium mantenii TaxID=560555 RepID=A0A1X0FX22_MYCNT|nr:hypothetical protein [Mycobacterium mantenii]MCV7242816.1 hypothetical protein [Mycobacterium mantenii]ORB06351.1 hypothetical protein BST30_10280 [Mycobacterium mantenii]BBY36522.1 putative lipoprotein LprH [Mycobacterium mantenii]
MALQARVAAVAVVAMLALGGCSAVVGGRAVRASGQSGGATSTTVKPPQARAQDLLLQSGDDTPFGAASAMPVGDTYFTSARPPDCSAALLFKGSPLRPAGSSDHAESAYQFNGPALYAESVDIYDNALDPHHEVVSGFIAVAQCRHDAVGMAPVGEAPPMRLAGFATPSEGVLVWTMNQPGWTCDYGLAVLPHVALLLSACNNAPGFPMADWAAKRRTQVDGRTA